MRSLNKGLRNVSITVLLLVSAILSIMMVFMVMNENNHSNSVNTDEPTYVVSKGKHFTYRDFSELDGDTDIIIRGTKTDAIESILKKIGIIMI
jgi:lipopolysaccharide export system protein LptC